MKKWLLILILILGLFSILSAKLIILEFNDGTSFKCEPLYCSDSLLYIWTGFDEFNINYLSNNSSNNIHAIKISNLNKIMLMIPKSMDKSAKKAFTSTLLIGGAITLINFRDQDMISIIAFNGLFNGLLGSGLTLLLNIFTNIPRNLNMTKLHKYDRNIRIIRNYCLIQKHQEINLINKMIREVQP